MLHDPFKIKPSFPLKLSCRDVLLTILGHESGIYPAGGFLNFYIFGLYYVYLLRKQP